MGRKVIDLDADRNAAQREATDDGIAVVLKGREWLLPPQLPTAVLDPLIDGELDDLLALLLEVYGDGSENVADMDVKRIMGILARNPRLLSTVLRALRGAFEELLGEEQWVDWLALRPSLPDYLLLGRALLGQYGVGLGEALGLRTSSAAAGTISRPTAKRAASTRGGSGTRRGTRN